MDQDEINNRLRKMYDKNYERDELIKQITEEKLKRELRNYKSFKPDFEYFIKGFIRDNVAMKIALEENSKVKERYTMGFYLLLIYSITCTGIIVDFLIRPSW